MESGNDSWRTTGDHGKLRAWHISAIIILSIVVAIGLGDWLSGANEPPFCPPGTSPIRMLDGTYSSSCGVYDEKMLDGWEKDHGAIRR
jgi:hypothetical protein